MDNQPGKDLPDPLVVSVDAQDTVAVSDPALGVVRWFSKEGIEHPEVVPLDFVPTLAPSRVNQFLALIGGMRGIVLDTISKRVIGRFLLPCARSARSL